MTLKQSSHRITPSDLDARGRVAVWLFKEQRWAWRHPIDAREIVGMDAGSFDGEDGKQPRPTPRGKPGDRMVPVREEITQDDGSIETAPSSNQGGASGVPRGRGSKSA